MARWGAISVLLLGLGCGGRSNVNTTGLPEETVERTLPLADVWVLEAGGTPPDDTTQVVTAGRQRVVVLRNGAPDLTTFALLTFPDSAIKAAPGTEVTLRVDVRPGVYGVDVSLDAETVGSRIIFKYARHFEAPVAAIQKYGNADNFERQLAIGLLNDDGTITLLPTRRPSQDNLSAPFRGSGSYVVAGPK